MQYSNKHLIEVNCGFQFLEETAIWDSTYFGQFYEKIKSTGFTERQERKGVQIKFGAIAGPQITTSELEDQVVFSNPEKKEAIVIGRSRISFHCIGEYKGWEYFLNEFIVPYSEKYISLGLGNGKRQCSMVYLNRFLRGPSIDLSDYFTIINPVDIKFGKEVNTSIQRAFANKHHSLIAKLNSQLLSNGVNINLECGAICVDEECMNNSSWSYQANNVHKPIYDFFESLLTDKLKKELL